MKYQNFNSLSQIRNLKEAIGIMQHHDAITGTEKQHVADDYARILSSSIAETMKNVKNSIAYVIGMISMKKIQKLFFNQISAFKNGRKDFGV